jgi:hypothetical protein
LDYDAGPVILGAKPRAQKDVAGLLAGFNLGNAAKQRRVVFANIENAAERGKRGI